MIFSTLCTWYSYQQKPHPWLSVLEELVQCWSDQDKEFVQDWIQGVWTLRFFLREKISWEICYKDKESWWKNTLHMRWCKYLKSFLDLHHVGVLVSWCVVPQIVWSWFLGVSSQRVNSASVLPSSLLDTSLILKNFLRKPEAFVVEAGNLWFNVMVGKLWQRFSPGRTWTCSNYQKKTQMLMSCRFSTFVVGTTVRNLQTSTWRCW